MQLYINNNLPIRFRANYARKKYKEMLNYTHIGLRDFPTKDYIFNYKAQLLDERDDLLEEYCDCSFEPSLIINSRYYFPCDGSYAIQVSNDNKSIIMGSCTYREYERYIRVLKKWIIRLGYPLRFAYILEEEF